MPLLADLYLSVVPRYAVHWKSIGVLLGLEQHHIDNISENNAYNPNRVIDGCAEMLKKWLKFDTSASWGKLENAIYSLKVSSTSTISDGFHHVKGKVH